MSPFNGFPEGKSHLIPLPAAFFSELLPNIEHLGELKLTLYAFWKLDQMEGTFRYLRRSLLLQDATLIQNLGAAPSKAASIIDDCLERAVARGTLLSAIIDLPDGRDDLYFLNSPKGRAAIRAIQSGQWRLAEGPAPAELPAEPPNIFRLYEENIGPLTPLIADSLGEAADTYPATWIEEAMRIAVEKNKRNWRYILAILERWQREGYHARKEKSKDRRDTEEDRRRYVEGEFSDFIEH